MGAGAKESANWPRPGGNRVAGNVRGFGFHRARVLTLKISRKARSDFAATDVAGHEAKDGAQRELRPTGRAKLPLSRDPVRVQSVFRPWLKFRCRWLRFQNQPPLGGGEHSPGARAQAGQLKLADLRADEPQGRMANGRGHAPDLAIFALDQFQTQPADRHGFAQTDRRWAGRNFRLRLQNPGAARQRLPAAQHDAALELLERLGRRLAFD